MWLSDNSVDELIELAIGLNSEELVDGALVAVSHGRFDLDAAKTLMNGDAAYEDEERELLGRAAKLTTKDSKVGPGRKGWFKTVARMEQVGEKVLGPGLANAKPELRTPILKLFRQSDD